MNRRPAFLLLYRVFGRGRRMLWISALLVFIGCSALVFWERAEAILQCESISQTAVDPGGWLAAAAPPDAIGLSIQLYARRENGPWVECERNSTCNGIVFPPNIDSKIVEPEKYIFFYLRPRASSSSDGKYLFATFGQARLGVRYGTAGPMCRSIHIIEIGPSDYLETILLVPKGGQVGKYSWFQKANIKPPIPPPPPWIDCTDGHCGFPHLLVTPFADDGGDKAAGFRLNCANRTFDTPMISQPVRATACRVDVPYTP
jgi:hypothetical protein